MSDVTANELKAELAGLEGVLKDRLDTIEKTVDAAGVTRSEELDRLHADIERVEKSLDELQTTVSRPDMGGDGGNGVDEQRAAFGEFLRKGYDGMSPESRKALSRGDNAAGGYLVGEGVASELIEVLRDVSDIRSLAGQVTLTEGDSYPYNKRTANAAAVMVGELETRSETTNPAYGKGRIPVHESIVFIDISRQLMDMAGYDVEGDWLGQASEAIAELEGAKFCNGSGSKEPVGIFHANGGLQASYVASGNAATLSADVLLGMDTQLKPAYTKNASWVMERASLRAVKQMKDGNGAYLWTAGYGTTLASGAPATIAGYRYLLAEDAPTIGANTYPIAFGDFKAGYKIVDHVKMHQIRDEVTQATAGNVRFIMTRYFGGGVVNTEAIKLIKCATS